MQVPIPVPPILQCTVEGPNVGALARTMVGAKSRAASIPIPGTRDSIVLHHFWPKIHIKNKFHNDENH